MLAKREDIRVEALDELHRILQSPAFRSSPRCQQFLRFVVEQAVDGHFELLKERMIGIEVFGRDPAYQTEGDSVVRVRATDVRRRLTQYYSTAGDSSRLRIEISAGSYVPTFLPASSPRILEVETHTDTGVSENNLIASVHGPPVPGERDGLLRVIRWPAALTAALFLCLCALGAKLVFGSQRTPQGPDVVLRRFWGPAILDSKPILICIGSPITYTYSRAYRAEYPQTNDVSSTQRPPISILPASPNASASNIVPVVNQYVGAGDANAATLLSALFGRLGKADEFRIAPETSYAELSDTPTVLIGAFTNRWTLETMNSMPFGFREINSIFVIEEHAGQKRTWTPPQIRFDGKTDIDYAVVSRVLDSKTGQFLVTAAGLTNYGSRAAGYFLTRPELLDKGLKGLPSDWEHKNIQFVLKTQIVDGSPTAPEVVARSIW